MFILGDRINSVFGENGFLKKIWVNAKVNRMGRAAETSDNSEVDLSQSHHFTDEMPDSTKVKRLIQLELLLLKSVLLSPYCTL